MFPTSMMMSLPTVPVRIRDRLGDVRVAKVPSSTVNNLRGVSYEPAQQSTKADGTDGDGNQSKKKSSGLQQWRVRKPCSTVTHSRWRRRIDAVEARNRLDHEYYKKVCEDSKAGLKHPKQVPVMFNDEVTEAIEALIKAGRFEQLDNGDDTLACLLGGDPTPINRILTLPQPQQPRLQLLPQPRIQLMPQPRIQLMPQPQPQPRPQLQPPSQEDRPEKRSRPNDAAAPMRIILEGTEVADFVRWRSVGQGQATLVLQTQNHALTHALIEATRRDAQHTATVALAQAREAAALARVQELETRVAAAEARVQELKARVQEQEARAAAEEELEQEQEQEQEQQQQQQYVDVPDSMVPLLAALDRMK
jgi:hypothetical protein